MNDISVSPPQCQKVKGLSQQKNKGKPATTDYDFADIIFPLCQF